MPAGCLVNQNNRKMDELSKRLDAIEKRLRKIEADLERVEMIACDHATLAAREKKHAGLAAEHARMQEEQQPEILVGFGQEGLHFETQIGGQGLALLGNLVLLFGVIFLNQWVVNLGQSFIGTVMGYLCAAALFLLARYATGKEHPFLGLLFRINAFILLFYITLMLHFFSSTPLIRSETPGLILLVGVVVAETAIAVRNRSELFTILTLLLAMVTAIVSDRTYIMLGMATLSAVLSTVLLYRLQWRIAFVISILLVYMTFILWFFNNPFMGHPLEARNSLQGGYIYLFASGILFALVPLMKLPVKSQPALQVSALWFNQLSFSLVLMLLVLQFFPDNYTGLFLIITACCLGYATFLRIRTGWMFGSAFYSLYGFMTLSIAIYGVVDFPDTYLYLALESLLVVSMALWFRNKLIVIMNGIMFMILLIAYFISPEHTSPVNFTYAFIPLITARVMNWKKERLEIKTDMLRNLYLVLGFAAVLYAMYNAVPSTWVTLAWTITAVAYFLFSFVIRNVKYRIMGIGMVIASAFHLFLVDLSRVEIAYRVLAFMFLAIISIMVSVFYTRQHRKQKE